MALESATYIDGLNVSNPASSDLMAQADDHIRMLKAVLKNTFPNINSPVTQTPHMLNNAVVPIGGIILWSGSASAVPTGWRLCDGGTYAKSDGSGNITVPDLRGVFVRGCGGSTSAPTTAPLPGSTGGADTITPSVTVGATALTQANLPAVNFTVTDPGHTHTATATVTDPGHTHGLKYSTGPNPTQALNNSPLYVSSTTNYQTNSATTGITVSVSNTSNPTGISVASGGSDTPHTHSVTVGSFDNRPAYYTLAYIIKI